MKDFSLCSKSRLDDKFRRGCEIEINEIRVNLTPTRFAHF